MESDKSYVCGMLKRHLANLSGIAVMLGSANLPFHEVQWIKGLNLDFNAAEGKRFERLFPGCTELDLIEKKGEELFQSLFPQAQNYCISFDPISGTQANQIVYNAILKPQSTVLAMSVKSGGHASHIDYLKMYHTVIEYQYSEELQNLDYNTIELLCAKHRPNLIIAGASSFPLEIRYDILGDIAHKYNIPLLADISHTALYILEGYHVTPFGKADFISFTTHKTTRGPRGAILLYKNSYVQEIEKSIFPISQGAPIYTQICSKVAMLECLNNRVEKKYCNDILKLTDLFIQRMKYASIPLWLDISETHLCILDLSNFPQSADVYQAILESSGIYVNSCYLPGRSKKTGLRFGFMYLATLNIKQADFLKLTDIVIRILLSGSPIDKRHTEMIMQPYYYKFMEKQYE